MKAELAVQNPNSVTLANALARAGHGLTLAEKRLVMLAVSKLDPRKPLTREESLALTTKITASEYADAFGVERHTAYPAMKDAADNLLKRIVTFYAAPYRRNGKTLKQTITKMHWVGAAKYHQGEGWVELHWWHMVVPYLTGLRKQFTTYQLEQASALRSVYSWRLLELLMRFKSTGWADYPIEDFCVSMEATEKQRSDFAAIRRKIIEPAIKELQEKDGWLIRWEAIKAGRKVSRLVFHFERNPQTSLF